MDNLITVCAKCQLSPVLLRKSDKRNRIYSSKFCAECAPKAKSFRQQRYNTKGRKSALCKKMCGRCWTNPHLPGLRYCAVCKENDCQKAKVYNSRNRELVFDHYGRICKCCGETIAEFLTIDHEGGWGKDHRSESGYKYNGATLYRWLVANNFPLGFRTLCFNCNCSQAHTGYCPHELNRPDISYPGQEYFHKHNPNIARAELNWQATHHNSNLPQPTLVV